MKRTLADIKHWLLRLWYLVLPHVKKHVHDMMVKAIDNKPKSQGERLWDGRLGTYRRKAVRIGRNEPCPCGAMRVAPRDTTKRMKAKWCCGGMQPISILKGSA